MPKKTLSEKKPKKTFLKGKGIINQMLSESKKY